MDTSISKEVTVPPANVLNLEAEVQVTEALVEYTEGERSIIESKTQQHLGEEEEKERVEVMY